MSPLRWQKFTYGQEGANCLNLDTAAGAILLRESDDPATVLTTTPAALDVLLRGIKAGRLDAPAGS